MSQYVIEYYKMGLYTIDDMRGFCQCEWITPEQFKEATGQDYQPVTSESTVVPNPTNSVNA